MKGKIYYTFPSTDIDSGSMTGVKHQAGKVILLEPLAPPMQLATVSFSKNRKYIFRQD